MSPGTEIRHALIVATAEYSDPKLQRLRAPAADADRLAAVLGNPEIGAFDVEIALDGEERELRRSIARFFSNRRPTDLLFLHVSCHGVKDAHGDLYLAATDTELDLLSATGVPAAWLNEQLSRTRSRRTVVLLDCCFSGSFPFGARARVGGDVNMPDQFEGHGRGIAVITASSAMEYAYEGDSLTGEGQPSFFTEAVVEALESGRADRDQDHLISVQELYDFVYDCIKEKTPGQTPNMKSELQGPLYLARSTYRPPVTPAKLDEHLIALTEHRYAGAREGAVHELKALLSSRHPGTVLAARQALERMVDDDSRRVSEQAKAALKGTSTLQAESRKAPSDTAVKPVTASRVETPLGAEAGDQEPPSAEQPTRRSTTPSPSTVAEPHAGQSPPSTSEPSRAAAKASPPKAPIRPEKQNRKWGRLAGIILVVAVVTVLAITTNSGGSDCGGGASDFQSGDHVRLRALANEGAEVYRFKDEGRPCELGMDLRRLERKPYQALLFNDLGALRNFDQRPSEAVLVRDTDGGGTLDPTDVGSDYVYTSVTLRSNFRSHQYFGIVRLDDRGASSGQLVLYQLVDRIEEPA
jgi:hypothetical protein